MEARDREKSILVVEDEDSPRGFLGELLAGHDYRVETVPGKAAAIEALGSVSFDLAIVDKNLEEGSGIEVLEHIARENLDTGGLILTGFPGLDSTVDAFRLGAADLLRKPIQPDALLAALERSLEQQRKKIQDRRRLAEFESRVEELEQLVTLDPLTRLLNHAHFQERLGCELIRAERHGLSLSLLFIDVDDFKQVNDGLGHLHGDRLLRTLGQILRGRVEQQDLEFRWRAQDTAARYGGDEFAVLLPETPKRGAATKGELLRAFVAGRSGRLFDSVGQTISIGVAAYPDDAQDRLGLIRAADQALYAAKRTGKNRLVTYTPAFSEVDAKRAIPPEELERLKALERIPRDGVVDFAFQPIRRSADGALVGFEALCRPREETLPNPGVLFEVAERAGRIGELGRVLREQIVSIVPELPEQAMLFVNLHPQELFDPQLGTEADPLRSMSNRIVFELNEISSFKNLGYVRDAISRLHTSDYHIALDDLGSGYSGLSSLSVLEPEFVKLDRGLVQAITREPRAARLVRHLLEFARDEGMQVVAQGIESQAQQDVVTEMGCPLVQGFHVGLPAPLESYGPASLAIPR